MKDKDELIRQIKIHLGKVFGQRKYFAIVYGSFANGRRNFESDVDLCVITEEFSVEELMDLIQFILDFHRQNKLKIDNEVPFENKLMASYKDAEDAVYLASLEINRERIIVPPVEKTKDFLESKAVKLRLIFNALTSPHTVMGNDLGVYQKLKYIAEKNAFLLAESLSLTKNLDLDQLLHKLMTGLGGEEGEMYLGYKRYPLVETYMRSWLQKQKGEFAKIDRKSEWKKLIGEIKKRSRAV